MRTEHPCIRIKGEVSAVKYVKALQYFLLTVPRQCFFCVSFSLFMFHASLCSAVMSVPCSLVITSWERADLLALLCVMFSCVLSLSDMVSLVSSGA